MQEVIDQIENLEQILSTLRHEIGNSVNSLKVTLDVLRENYDRFDDEKGLFEEGFRSNSQASKSG
jgi:hypothetical protein